MAPTSRHGPLTRRLADLAKNDGPRFAEVVRRADAAQAAGVSRDEAYRLAFQRTGPEGDSGSLPG